MKDIRPHRKSKRIKVPLGPGKCPECGIEISRYAKACKDHKVVVRESKLQREKKEIDPKWLVRGNISTNNKEQE